MDLKERDALGDQAGTHWYYVSKARMITRHFPNKPSKLLDVGAGLGWFSHWLMANGYADSAVCVDPGYDADDTETVKDGRQIHYVRSIRDTDADMVLLMDVLEHVDDDVALLREYWDKAARGTVFVITVPAFRFLWSAHDEYLDHRRRYTTKMLDRTIRAVGGTPSQLHYFFGSIFPAAALVRLLKRNENVTQSDMKPVPTPLNTLLTKVCSIEAVAMKFNKIAGLSVVAQVIKE